MMFPNSNSPIMEQLLFFHDHSMIIIILITFMIMYMLIDVMKNKLFNRFLLEGHDIEMIWTVIPTFLLIFIALPSLQLLYLMEESFSPSLSIKILGHQWYWSYEYPDFNIEFDSFMIPQTDMNINSFRLLETDNRLIIPFNINTRFLISSTDVIHSWTIPALGVKMDAVPGRINFIYSIMTRPGLYFGQCSEICGANHSFMPIMLEVTSIKNFMNWIKNI